MRGCVLGSSVLGMLTSSCCVLRHSSSLNGRYGAVVCSPPHTYLQVMRFQHTAKACRRTGQDSPKRLTQSSTRANNSLLLLTCKAWRHRNCSHVGCGILRAQLLYQARPQATATATSQGMQQEEIWQAIAALGLCTHTWRAGTYSE